MATNLVQILSEKENYIIYYDRDVFNQDVTLSIHLTVPNISNQTGHVVFDNSTNEQWNTIYDEQFGTDGDIYGIKNINQAILFTPIYNTLNFQNDFAFVNSAAYIPDTVGNFTVAIDSAKYIVTITSPDAFSANKNISQLILTDFGTSYAWQTIIFDTKNDPNNNFNPANGRYTVPYDCVINFKATVDLTSSINTLNAQIRFFSNIKGPISVTNVDFLQAINRTISLETTSLFFSQNEEVWLEIISVHTNVSSVIVGVASIENAIGPYDNGTLYLSGQDIKYYRTVSGVPQYIEQSLQEIAVQIWAIPTFTTMIGEGTVPISSDEVTYHLPDDYDPGNVYTYEWRLRKIKNTDDNVANARATIVEPAFVIDPNDNKRHVYGKGPIKVVFTRNGFVNLECIITGPTGCPRIVRKQIVVELPLTKMLIIRNRLL